MSDADEYAAGRILPAIAELTDAATGIDRLIEQTAEHDHLPGLAELAGTLTDLKHLVAYMCDRVCAEILAVDFVGGPDDAYPIPSGGQLVRRSGSKRQRYDQAMVVGAIKARLSEHLSTGDNADTPVGILTASGERVPVHTLVGPVVDAMVAFTGAATESFASWRATPAKALGIKLSDYSEWSDGDPYISVEGRNPIVRAGASVLAGEA